MSLSRVRESVVLGFTWSSISSGRPPPPVPCPPLQPRGHPLFPLFLNPHFRPHIPITPPTWFLPSKPLPSPRPPEPRGQSTTTWMRMRRSIPIAPAPASFQGRTPEGSPVGVGVVGEVAIPSLLGSHRKHILLDPHLLKTRWGDPILW